MQSMKNALIQFCLSFSHKAKNQRGAIPRLLVVSTTGLGDSLWATPALRALRKRFPQAYIGVLTSSTGEQIFRYNPNVNEIFVLPSPLLFSLPKLVRTLRACRYDTAYLFHASQRLVLPAVFLANPSQIIGNAGCNKGLDFLLTDSLPSSGAHAIERRLEMVNSPGFCPRMELFLTEEENAAAFDHLVEGFPLIGIHPGARNRFKEWDPKYFADLGRLLVKEKKAKILVTGNTSECALAEKIAKQIPGAVSIAGKLSVRPFAALLEKLDFFITNDTGPLHLAIAMQTPTCSLFSPTDPTFCGPYQVSQSIVVQKPRSCVPCLRKTCAAPFCLSQISPSMVYEVIDAHGYP